ncbi:hypothetical protein ILYODFUR_034663, partial [Ilyodon furcidens]
LAYQGNEVIHPRIALSRACRHFGMTHKHSCNPPQLTSCHSEKDPHKNEVHFSMHSNALCLLSRRESASKSEDVWPKENVFVCVSVFALLFKVTERPLPFLCIPCNQS